MHFLFLMSFVCHWYATRLSSTSSLRDSYVLVCHLYVTRMASVCHQYELVCHSYVSRLYSLIICISLVYARMSSVCHPYVLVFHFHVTRMHSYVTRSTHMSLVCIFTMNCQQLNRYVFSKVIECLEQNIQKKIDSKRLSNTKKMKRVQNTRI